MSGAATLPLAGAALPQARALARSLRREQVTWWLSLASLCGFVLQNRFGTAAMVVCLGSWALHAAAYPADALAGLRRHALPWLLPLWALASTVWSDEPALSFKLGLELVVFTGVALMTAHAQTPRRFIAAFLCALLVGVIGSALFGGRAMIGTTGENALIGLFGSKNNFAAFICLMLLAATAALFDRAQPKPIRALAAFGLAIGPVLLMRALSLGALLAGGSALLALGGVLVLSWLPRRQRALVVVLGLVLSALLGGVMMLALAGHENLSQLLVAAGKDPSLTGRTYLWQRAAQYIADRPMFGLGYQAFWVQGHVEAEGLWRYAQIDTRAGFHFHNLYYETAVELGMVGVVLLALTLVLWLAAVVVWLLRRPDPCSGFFAGLMVFYAMRVSVELDFLGPFSSGSFLLPLGWAYAASALRQLPAARHAVAQRGGASGASAA